MENLDGKQTSEEAPTSEFVKDLQDAFRAVITKHGLGDENLNKTKAIVYMAVEVTGEDEDNYMTATGGCIQGPGHVIEICIDKLYEKDILAHFMKRAVKHDILSKMSGGALD